MEFIVISVSNNLIRCLPIFLAFSTYSDILATYPIESIDNPTPDNPEYNEISSVLSLKLIMFKRLTASSFFPKS